MRVLITGGAGRLGRALTQLVLQSGRQARVFDLPSCDFSGLEGAEVVAGDIANAAAVDAAVEGTDLVVHPAAILPPLSERSSERTLAINVGGTERVVASANRRGIPVVLASSVAVYGRTADKTPPVRTDWDCHPLDVYGESKLRAEEVVRGAGGAYTILRVSGIAVPAFLQPPAVWPFAAEQRMEFVALADVAAAFHACVEGLPAGNRTLHVSGGSTWRMLGRQYVAELYRTMDIPLEEARYLPAPGYFDWNDTGEANELLGYQETGFPAFLEQLKQAVEEALA